MNNSNHSVDEVHTYSLKQLVPHSTSPLVINFTPIITQKGKLGGVTPEYNNDHSPFTPGFILPIEKESPLPQINSCLAVRGSRPTKQLLIAQPLNKFCQVCSESFSDYNIHIDHQVHKRNLRNSQINQHIEDLIFNFRNCKDKHLFQSFSNPNEKESEQKIEIRVFPPNKGQKHCKQMMMDLMERNTLQFNNSATSYVNQANQLNFLNGNSQQN